MSALINVGLVIAIAVLAPLAVAGWVVALHFIRDHGRLTDLLRDEWRTSDIMRAQLDVSLSTVRDWARVTGAETPDDMETKLEEMCHILAEEELAHEDTKHQLALMTERKDRMREGFVEALTEVKS